MKKSTFLGILIAIFLADTGYSSGKFTHEDDEYSKENFLSKYLLPQNQQNEIEMQELSLLANSGSLLAKKPEEIEKIRAILENQSFKEIPFKFKSVFKELIISLESDKIKRININSFFSSALNLGKTLMIFPETTRVETFTVCMLGLLEEKANQIDEQFCLQTRLLAKELELSTNYNLLSSQYMSPASLLVSMLNLPEDYRNQTDVTSIIGSFAKKCTPMISNDLLNAALPLGLEKLQMINEELKNCENMIDFITVEFNAEFIELMKNLKITGDKDIIKTLIRKTIHVCADKKENTFKSNHLNVKQPEEEEDDDDDCAFYW